MDKGSGVERILETSLYVGDVPRAAAFYVDVLGLAPLELGGGFAALDAHGGNVLLLFRHGAAADGKDTNAGWIPPHDGRGRCHVAFAVEDGAALERWADRLRGRGVDIESRVAWPRGGWSLYFRDPDGHSVELATRDIWLSPRVSPGA